jgi:hypothetical protein
MLRGSAAAIVVAIVAAGIVAASTMRSRADTSTAAHTPAPVTTAAPEPIASHDTVDTTTSIVVPAAPVVHAAPAPATPVPPFTPVIPMGLTSLLNGVSAIRSDTDVVVSFDVSGIRTRQPPKFEQVVRQTLGAVYGTPAVVFLEKIPEGDLANQGNLLTELPQRGVRIPVRLGWTIRVFPETRPGQDGPLVIRYRTFLAPTSE